MRVSYIDLRSVKQLDAYVICRNTHRYVVIQLDINELY